MACKVNISLDERSYPIWVGAGVLGRLPAALSGLRGLVVTDAHVDAFHGAKVMDMLGQGWAKIILPPGESSKSASRWANLLEQIAAAKLDGGNAHFDPSTLAVTSFDVGNPAGNVADLGAMADMAHAHGIPLIVDNTVPTPYLCRPFEHGADIVVHALTKYLGGHGTTIGGALVDSGKFPWAEHKARFRRLNEPDVSYHGVVYTEALGPAAYIGRARVVPLRNMGAAISPFNSFLILQGIETLHVRMDRHCDNALAVAQFLQAQPQVAWVRYAGLPDHPDNPLVNKYMGGRASSILSFGIKGGREAGAKFIDALQLAVRLVNIGDAKTLACHPATTTHRQLAPAELARAGVSEDMVRLSIGLEHIDDIVADLAQALVAAG